jgi:glycosyltransferase involved in cell wall biosynthesis
MDICIIAPPTLGGVTTITQKLVAGLKKENIQVDLILGKNISRYSLLKYWTDSFKARGLDCDATIFLGSVAPPSIYFLQQPRIVFIHGFLVHEILSTFRSNTPLRTKIGGFLNLSQFILQKFSADLFICHSATTCEFNNVSRYVLLPQYILPEEIAEREPRQKELRQITVVAYASFVQSPRLLEPEYFLPIFKRAAVSAGRETEVVVVDPRRFSVEVREFGPLRVKFLPRQPKDKFLGLLGGADLFFEECVDEELRYSSIEAGLLGTPIAKLTHPRFWKRQDYGEDEIVLARSVKELTEKLAEYLRNIEHHREHYSKAVRNFVITKRHWDYVKQPLLNALRILTID